MIKVEVREKNILVLGHANFDDYGKDIVCAAVSSVVITSVEAIARFDKDAITVNKEDNGLEIVIVKHDEITTNLLDNMLVCLKEIEKKYSKNIKIFYKEE